MIKFFRNIRKTLLNEGKTSRYLWYALGEIFLVVIGILIALQLNNWNERQKDKNTEQELLSDILTAIKKDKGRTTGIYYGRALVKKKALDSLVHYVNESKNLQDSILIKTLKEAVLTLSFSYDKGPYESLKSYGLDKIQNDTLRKILVRFYEVDLPLRIVFIDNDRATESQRRAELLGAILGYRFVQNTEGQWNLEEFLPLKGLKEDRAFQQLISLEQNVTKEYEFRLQGAIDRFDWIIELLENELKEVP